MYIGTHLEYRPRFVASIEILDCQDYSRILQVAKEMHTYVIILFTVFHVQIYT